MVRRRAAPSPDEASHRRENHEAPLVPFILRDAASRLLRMRSDTQSNRLDTDSSDAVRLIASAVRGAIVSVRILAALLTASVGRIESVMTSSFSLEPAIRAAAPPDSTPWEM